jgi:hypothetical protein
MSGFEVGDRVAGYELLELVGEGRLGQVYRALQPRLERMVAVKIIRPDLAEDESFRERFRREMRLAASVDHPNVLPVYEAGESEGALFEAMRWVAGPDLHQLIAERGALDPAQAVRIVARVAAALEAAHGVGLVHRDLRPTNVLLEGDRVYLSDFGLAAVTDTVHGEGLAGSVGGIEYAAPELLDDAPPDSRTDVYGLGCVLYEMLTGSVPFPPESLAISSRSPGARAPVPASERRRGLPPAIDGVLRRAMAPAPADRFRTPVEFVDAVEGALGSGVDPGKLRAGRRRRLFLALATVVILAAAAVAVVIALGSDGSDSPAPKAAGPVGGRTLPAVATLPDCGHTFSGPPRDCHSSGGGINVIGDLGKPIRMATMDFTATRVRAAPTLRDSSGASFTAPTGTRFVVIDATVTNVTKAEEEFEPDNLSLAGRSSALWFFDQDNNVVPYHGPGGADYSVQYNPAVSTLRTPLSEVTLYPGVPYSGQLVFYYPDSTLKAHHRALLEVTELGRSFDYAKSVGGVRLHLGDEAR